MVIWRILRRSEVVVAVVSKAVAVVVAVTVLKSYLLTRSIIRHL
jgi:hypothetical protein